MDKGRIKRVKTAVLSHTVSTEYPVVESRVLWYIELRKVVMQTMTNKAQVIDKAKEDKEKLELYRLIGEGYKAIQENRETSIDDVVRKLEQSKANRD